MNKEESIVTLHPDQTAIHKGEEAWPLIDGEAVIPANIAAEVVQSYAAGEPQRRADAAEAAKAAAKEKAKK